MSKIMVTGGAGFIGSHLVQALLEQGNEVVVFDNLSSGDKSNLHENSNLTFIEGNILDAEALMKAAEGCSMIYHLAEYLPNTAKSGPGHVVKYSYDYPIQDFEVSVRGTLNVLGVARALNAKMLFTSTAAVYGSGTQAPLKELDPKDPVSPYGMSKFVAEQYCQMFAKLYGLDVKFVRIFNTYGPRQRKYVACDTIRKLEKDPNELEVLGSGEATRDFIYVKDTANALMLVAEKGKRAEAYNVGNGKEVTIKELVETIAEVMNLNPKIKFTGSSWKGDVSRLISDNSKLKKLGYEPSVKLKDGIKNLLEWMKANP